MRASVATDAPEPVLQLVAQDGAVLKFTGEPTPETRYGSKGETMFWKWPPSASSAATR